MADAWVLIRAVRKENSHSRALKAVESEGLPGDFLVIFWREGNWETCRFSQRERTGYYFALLTGIPDTVDVSVEGTPTTYNVRERIRETLIREHFERNSFGEVSRYIPRDHGMGGDDFKATKIAFRIESKLDKKHLAKYFNGTTEQPANDYLEIPWGDMDGLLYDRYGLTFKTRAALIDAGTLTAEEA